MRALNAAPPPQDKKKQTDAKTGKPTDGAPGDIIIDVIVAYTAKAARNYNDIASDLVELAVEDANQSFRISNLGHVKLRLVHAYQTDYVEDGPPISITSGGLRTRATDSWRRSTACATSTAPTWRS